MANGAAAVARLDNWFWTSSPPARDVLSGEIFDDPRRAAGPMEHTQQHQTCRSWSSKELRRGQEDRLRLLTLSRAMARVRVGVSLLISRVLNPWFPLRFP